MKNDLAKIAPKISDWNDDGIGGRRGVTKVQKRRGRPLARSLSAPSLSKSQRREFHRRLNKLKEFADFKTKGLSDVAAARLARVNPTTLWRWQRGIHRDGLDALVPRFNLSGRKSAADKLPIPLAVIVAVQRLQLTGKGNVAAWLAFADDPKCPPALASFLRSAKTIPRSLLQLTRLEWQPAKLIRGAGFTHVVTKGGRKR